MAAGEIHIELAVNYADDPKMIALARWPKDARSARDLYVQMLCYAKYNMTDGIVPAEVVARLVFPDGPSIAKRQASMLAEVGLIEAHEIGWNVCAYLRRNKSRAQIEELSAVRREMGKRGGKQSGRSRRGEANTKQVAKGVASVGLNTESETESETVVSTSVGSSPDVSREPDHREEPRSSVVTPTSYVMAREYLDRVPLADKARVSGVVQQAMTGGYERSAIKAALRRLAADSRPVTPDTLRIEIEGKGGKPEPKLAYTPPRNGMRGREGW